MVKLDFGKLKNKVTSIFGEDKVEEPVNIIETEPVPGFVDVSNNVDNKKIIRAETLDVGKVTILSTETTTPSGVVFISGNDVKQENSMVKATKPESSEVPAVTQASVMTTEEVQELTNPVILKRHTEMPKTVQEESHTVVQTASTEPKTLFRQETISKIILGVTVTSVCLSVLIGIYDLGLVPDAILVVVASIVQFLLVAEYRKPTTVD